MAISKEEKAVRDALAKFEKDFATSSAAVASMNQPTATPKTAAQAMAEYRAGERGQTVPTIPVGPTGATGPTTTTGPTLTNEQYLAQQAAKLAADQALQNRQSAFDLLRAQFADYGLEALVDPLKSLIQENISPSEFTVRLRQTEPYKKRFAANAQRIASGLRALSEAEYLTLEDKYQNIMRNYGLPPSYYAKGDMGRQEGFEKFIAGDVSATELEDRIITAQKRVIQAPAETKQAFKEFFPNITDSDILGYVLDPSKGLQEIKRKVTAAEIGGAAIGQGLATSLTRAEQLAGAGITGETARQGYQAVAGMLPRAQQLSEFYKESPYTQQTAEQEIFNLAGGTEAANLRKKLTQKEQAAFGGKAGTTAGALGRERAGSF